MKKLFKTLCIIAVFCEMRIVRSSDLHRRVLVHDTSLIVAADKGDIEAVKAFLRAGFDVNLSDESGSTALHMAAKRGDRQMVELLLAEGAQVDMRNTFIGWTALYWANRSRHCDVVQVLLAAGADVNVADDQGTTALHLAARPFALKKDDILSILLAYGADVNARDNGGSTALHIAAYSGRVTVVQNLINAGATVDLRDAEGKTALYRAVAKARNSGETALYRALDTSYLEVIRALLAAGADVNQRDNDGRSALDIARQNAQAFPKPEAQEILVALEGNKRWSPARVAWLGAVIRASRAAKEVDPVVVAPEE